MRYAAIVEYQGTAYVGWQRQPNGPTVQGHLDAALSEVANTTTESICAGRTDTGVHALGQVVHFDTLAERSLRGWQLGLNSLLPTDISVGGLQATRSEFHARFSAEWRSYQYWILNKPLRSALYAQRAFHVHQALNEDRMHAAAKPLIGTHDFSSFRAAGCQASSPVRRVMQLSVRRIHDWLVIDVRANAFLQHMVRNITGLLVKVGSGDLPIEAAAEILAACDRTQAPFAAPAHGLYFCAVGYPAEFGIELPTISTTAIPDVQSAPAKV